MKRIVHTIQITRRGERRPRAVVSDGSGMSVVSILGNVLEVGVWVKAVEEEFRAQEGERREAVKRNESRAQRAEGEQTRASEGGGERLFLGGRS